jgi:hypothetical protein
MDDTDTTLASTGALLLLSSSLSLNIPGLAKSVNQKIQLNAGIQHIYDMNYLWGFCSAAVVYISLSLLFPAEETLLRPRFMRMWVCMTALRLSMMEFTHQRSARKTLNRTLLARMESCDMLLQLLGQIVIAVDDMKLDDIPSILTRSLHVIVMAHNSTQSQCQLTSLAHQHNIHDAILPLSLAGHHPK